MNDPQSSSRFTEDLDAVLGGNNAGAASDSSPDRPVLEMGYKLDRVSFESDPARKAALRQLLLIRARQEFPKLNQREKIVRPIRQFSKLVLPVLALIVVGVGLAWLIPSLRPVSAPAVGATTTFVPSPSSIPAATPTLVSSTAAPQPTLDLSAQQTNHSIDSWDPMLYHPIFQKWVESYPAFSPAPFTTQSLALDDSADGHQVLTAYYCEAADPSIVLLDATRRCMMIRYSDEKQDLNPQAFLNCSIGCLKDLREIQVQGTTGYLGWAESNAGGNWTEIHWRKDGVTITMALFGDWPQPDEANPHRLDNMLMWAAESLGQQTQPVTTPYLPSDWHLIVDQASGLTYGVPKSWQANGETYQGPDGFVKLEPYTGPGAQMDEACEAEANLNPQVYGAALHIFSIRYDLSGELGYSPCLILPAKNLGPDAQATILIPDPSSTNILRIIALRTNSFYAMLVAYTLQYKISDEGIFKRPSAIISYTTPGPDQIPPNAKMETAALPGLGVEAYPVIDANLDAPGHMEFRALVPPEALDKRMGLRQGTGHNPLNPIQINGHKYSVAEIPEDNSTTSAQVSNDGVPIYTYHLLPHAAVTPIFRIGEYQGKWALEVNGMLVVDGQIMNAVWGYQEIFHWQELNGKPFFFFVKDGKTGIRYGDQELPGLYDQVFHHYCCEPAMFNVAGNDKMVWFYALKSGIWYYAEAFEN